MQRRPIELRVGGKSYRVVTSASEGELRSLAAIVSAKIDALTPKGRVATTESILLAAIALAHDAGAERERREQLERRTRDLLRRVLMRVDNALDEGEVAPSIED